MWSVLKITDGTKAGTVDILAILREWLPQLASAKGGGFWGGSTYTQGRQLFDKQLENILDTFLLSLVTGSQIETAALVNLITTLLDKGVAYWVEEFQLEPVWIEMRSITQAQSQYALIYDWGIPEMNAYFDGPFGTSGTLENITLILEHGLWMENEPKTGTAIELQSANSTITANTTRKRTWVSNFWDASPLTHVFVYDAAPAGWTNITGLTGVNLLPAVPAVGDILYVGVQEPGTASPFSNIVFNVGVAMAGLTITPYHSRGAGLWAALPVGVYPYQDDTNTFQRTGPNVVVFDYISGAQPWITDAVNGITAYWIKFEVTAAPGPVTCPTQVTDEIYTQEEPYYDIPSDQVEGTYPAQAKYELWRRDAAKDQAVTLNMIGTKTLLGLRTLSRGENFLAFLPTYDPILPANLAYTAVLGAFANAINTPWYRAHQWVPGGALADAIPGYWKIDDPLSREYSGTYRMFLRCKNNSPVADDIDMRIALSAGNLANVVFVSPRKEVVTVGFQVILDFGLITIPESFPDTNYIYELFLLLLCDSTATATNIFFYDLILMPVDECAVDLTVAAANNFQTFDQDEILIPDSFSNPKFNIIAPLLREDITGGTMQYALNWQARTPGENILNVSQADGQRVWTFLLYNQNYITGGEPDYRAFWNTAVSIRGWRNERYKTLRG